MLFHFFAHFLDQPNTMAGGDDLESDDEYLDQSWVGNNESVSVANRIAITLQTLRRYHQRNGAHQKFEAKMAVAMAAIATVLSLRRRKDQPNICFWRRRLRYSRGDD